MSLILDVFAAKGATTVCFLAGTKVHTQWGLADIEKLEVGVPVRTYNEETGEKEYKKIKKVSHRMTVPFPTWRQSPCGVTASPRLLSPLSPLMSPVNY